MFWKRKRVYVVKFVGTWVQNEETVERKGASTVRLYGDAHDALVHFEQKYPTLIPLDIKRID